MSKSHPEKKPLQKGKAASETLQKQKLGHRGTVYPLSPLLPPLPHTTKSHIMTPPPLSDLLSFLQRGGGEIGKQHHGIGKNKGMDLVYLRPLLNKFGGVVAEGNPVGAYHGKAEFNLKAMIQNVLDGSGDSSRGGGQEKFVFSIGMRGSGKTHMTQTALKYMLTGKGLDEDDSEISQSSVVTGIDENIFDRIYRLIQLLFTARTSQQFPKASFSTLEYTLLFERSSSSKGRKLPLSINIAPLFMDNSRSTFGCSLNESPYNILVETLRGGVYSERLFLIHPALKVLKMAASKGTASSGGGGGSSGLNLKLFQICGGLPTLSPPTAISNSLMTGAYPHLYTFDNRKATRTAISGGANGGTNPDFQLFKNSEKNMEEFLLTLNEVLHCTPDEINDVLALFVSSLLLGKFSLVPFLFYHISRISPSRFIQELSN